MEVHQIDELIKRVDLFHGLSREDVAKIFSKGMTMRVASGETIFHKGTVGNTMYIVLGGKVGVMDGGKVLAELRTGDMFGEMALVNQEPRSASVVAMEDSRLFVLNQSTFERLMTKRASIRLLLNIVQTLSKRLKQSNDKLSRFS